MGATLRPYQVPDYTAALRCLSETRAFLDGSDTGTGKTYVSLKVCETMGLSPVVLGTRAGRGGWEAAAKAVGVPIEYINYEKVRGRRKKDALAVERYEAELKVWEAARDRHYNEVGADNTEDMFDPKWDFTLPKPVEPRATAESDWVVEKPYGKGSFIKWKQDYAMMIFDEVHRCGGQTTLNSKLLIAAVRQAGFVMALSATAADDPRQMKALGYALGLHGLNKRTTSLANYRGWLFRHGCVEGEWGGMDFVQDAEKQRKTFEKLNAEVFPKHGFRMRKSEIPGFPQTSINTLMLSDDEGRAGRLVAKLHEVERTGQPGMELRQKLEVLKAPFLVDLAYDYAIQGQGVVVFVNFSEPLRLVLDGLRERLGENAVGFVDGSQAGERGSRERRDTLDAFQANRLRALVCNGQAAGESANMHDPTGRVERTTLICPMPSGRQAKQIVGRVNRDGGARSQQFIVLFGDTYEEEIAKRMAQKQYNVDLFNDADFLV